MNWQVRGRLAASLLAVVAGLAGLGLGMRELERDRASRVQGFSRAFD